MVATWWFFPLVLIPAVAATVLVIAWQHRKGRAGRPVAGTEGVVSAAIAVGWVVAIGSGLYAAVASVGLLLGQWPVPIMTEPYWPALPQPEHVSGIASVTQGGYVEATAIVADLAPEARAWNVVAQLLWAVGHVLVAIVAIRLCRGLRAGRGLSGTGRAFGLLATAIPVCAWGWQVAHQLAGMIAAEQVAPRGLGLTLGIEWPVPLNTLQIDLWPLLPLLGFGAMAVAFRYAEHLQRETEGLV